MSQVMTFQIRVKGHLDQHWQDRFHGWEIQRCENGDTLLTGPVVDQSELFGILRKVRDLGIPLLSLNRLKSVLPHDHGSDG